MYLLLFPPLPVQDTQLPVTVTCVPPVTLGFGSQVPDLPLLSLG